MKATVMRAGVTTALLYAARRFYRNWGTTKDECRLWLPGDELVTQPALVTTEGISIDATPRAVWPWLVQIGQDRAGLYGSHALHKLARLDNHDADRIHPEWQHLGVGDTVCLAPPEWLGLSNGIVATVADVDAERSLVLGIRSAKGTWSILWSVNLLPHWDDRCRVLIRTRVALRHPGAVLVAELAGPVNALVTRGLLIGVKRRAERKAQTDAAAACGE
ncbi:hypothetical protein EV580_0518 [Mycobacterium sp. BK086]|uniref:SRPBCC family protein n=1 Tax=Mycobacterium sp. BK086 TaxID=2512165 RepID=UPI0010607D43|nr:SRPBCC family protein [Mycobacterium sp. BK086]TDO17351.1 hypothetical protein EV580_0518 [Mycobacterium sp. BK086]